MPLSHKKLRIGILGCGAIGSRIAKSVKKELKSTYQLNGLYDITREKAQQLEKILKIDDLIKPSFQKFLQSVDIVVEAVNSPDTAWIIKQVIKARKHVLCMSVGRLLNAADIFRLATKNRCCVLLPSGAVAGIDAIKAASLGNISSITLTTRKPPSGFANNPHLISRGTNLAKITEETVLFQGTVDEAVKYFPQNINVAATVALASHDKSKVIIRIITSPSFKVNSHELEVLGDFGRIVTRTDNVVCPDNPKTSYLAVLSGIQTLRQFTQGLKIGT